MGFLQELLHLMMNAVLSCLPIIPRVLPLGTVCTNVSGHPF